MAKLVIESRTSFGWPKHPDVPKAPCRNGTVVHYNDKPKKTYKDHAACRAYWKWCRSFHMQERDWSDIGYSYFACPHGKILEGRGWGYSQAAQPGGNTTWTSVTFGLGEGQTPTAAAVEAYRLLRSHLRAKGMAAGEKCHSDFISTSCPGNTLRALVHSGKLRGGVTTPKPPKQPGIPSPTFPLPSGHWFGSESADAKNHSGYAAKDRPHITKIVDRLQARGWSIPQTDRYTTDVTNTIRKFQAEKGLSPDGLTGLKTWKALWESPIT
jgi:hypothetical protein